jgi:RNA polymerase sigma-70 factor (ECF subfamily)
MLGDSHHAEDLAQEAFVRVFTHRKEYQPSARFSTFLWRIALNLCYDELRRVRRRKESSLDSNGAEESSILPLLADPEPSPDQQAMQDEEADSVRKALLRLEVPLRTIVVMRHYENLKFREIAEILDLPEGTVKSRMAEAMTQLQQLLKAQIPEYQPQAFPKESFIV